MERNITFVITNNNSKTTIKTTATTLGELKQQMDREGISYENMDFMEGLTHTMLVDDRSILPTNVLYKGTYTNNLVIMLSNSQKKIKNGADIPTDRKGIYEFIKNNDLGSKIKEVFNKNYTNVPTKELYNFISIQNVSKPNKTNKTKDLSINNRNEAYEYIKKNNLSKTVSDKYHKSFTSLKTDVLLDFVNSYILAKTVDDIKIQKQDVTNGSDYDIDKNVVVIELTDRKFTDQEIKEMFKR